MHLRARTGSRRTLAAAAVLAAALTVGVAACASTKNAEPEEKTFPFEGTTLNVTAHGDRVDLVAADRSDVRVVRWFDHTLATGVRSSWSLRGGTLDLRADCTGFANCDARFRVEVPRGVTVLQDGQPTDLNGGGRGR